MAGIWGAGQDRAISITRIRFHRPAEAREIPGVDGIPLVTEIRAGAAWLVDLPTKLETREADREREQTLPGRMESGTHSGIREISRSMAAGRREVQISARIAA